MTKQSTSSEMPHGVANQSEGGEDEGGDEHDAARALVDEDPVPSQLVAVRNGRIRLVRLRDEIEQLNLDAAVRLEHEEPHLAVDTSMTSARFDMFYSVFESFEDNAAQE